MRRLSLNDTIFYNLGDCYITAAFVLDGPCDLAAIMAELEGVVAALPAMAERPVRVGVWSFARRTAFDLGAHVMIVRDPDVRVIDDLLPRLERLRRASIGPDIPPWRVFVLNPAEDGVSGPAAPLSALLVQARHGLADATRGLQILSRMAHFRREPRHREMAERLRSVDPAMLGGGIAVHDAGLSLLQVPRRGMSKDGDASERLAAVAASLVADASLFPHARPLRGNVGRTRFVRRRGGENGVGNHLKMVTVQTGATARRPRIRIPGLARAQELPVTQWLVALAPRRIARLAMRVWYSSFDALATLLPLHRRMVLGGRTVISAFGVPPLWGPVPLVLLALADGEFYHLTVVPGAGFSGSRELLHGRIAELLNPVAASDLSMVKEAEAAIEDAEQRAAARTSRAGRGRYGQGADGRSSRPVSVPASVKSP